jgi:hypothetical protein
MLTATRLASHHQQLRGESRGVELASADTRVGDFSRAQLALV